MEDSARHLQISILTSPSAWGGMEEHTVGLARALGEKGHDVSIFEVGSNYYGQGRTERIRNVSVRSLDIPKPIKNLGLLKAIRILGRLRGDVCIFPKGGFDEGSWFFDLAARIMFFRYITIEHLTSQPPPKSSRRHLGGLVPGVGLWWYRGKLDCFLRSLFSYRVVSVSNAVARVLIDHHRFPSGKVTTIHNGIDTGKFLPDPGRRAAVRDAWGIPRDALVFGAIGRLNPVKGYILALELFRELISGGLKRDARFVLVGCGPEYEALKSLAEDTNVREKVRLEGFTDRPWEIYPAFDVFLMPSRNEGLPLSLLEAMSCGCCPIAMGVGGIPEVITDRGMGWLVAPNDKAGFLDAMKEAAESDAGKLGEMGRRAREKVVLNFDADKQFPALARLIEEECLIR